MISQWVSSMGALVLTLMSQLHLTCRRHAPAGPVHICSPKTPTQYSDFGEGGLAILPPLLQACLGEGSTGRD